MGDRQNKERRVVIVSYVTSRRLVSPLSACCLCFFAMTGIAAMAAAQVPHVIRPDLDPPGAEPVAEGETPRLSPSEERRLLRQILWQPEESWDASAARAMEELLGRGRVRRLDEARFQLHLAADDWDLRNLTDDPYNYERTKDAVLSSYVKIQREILEDAFQIEERFDAWVDRVTHREERSASSSGPRPRSYRLRISPRISVGSRDYLGVKLRLPYTRNVVFDSLSFKVRHYFDEDRTAFMLKYDDDDIFLHLEYEPDTELAGDEVRGDQVKLSMRFWF